ncbi:MAG: hypothetical protein NTV00_06785 [Methylococcales bacterium]|nr:hypothetical protein [Methylococcales bacterium]
MNENDQEFLTGMVQQLDESIRKLVLEEHALCTKLGDARVQELKEFWDQTLPSNEENDFKRSLDYWDKILIRTWAHLRRAHNSRAEVGKTFMKLNSKL